MKKEMKVLVVGGGGREHALAWKIMRSPLIKEVICAPGNPGTAILPRCRNISIKPSEIEKLGEFCREEKVGLVVVGPEEPLNRGIADFFEVMGIPIFGPLQIGAMLEGSKSFAKGLMKRHNIPTADYETFIDPSKARDYINSSGLYSKVIKADGLTGGKGVSIYNSLQEAYEFIDKLMKEKIYGEAGETILIEDRLKGKETSYLFFTDGKHIIPLESSEDHKALLDNDKGPNTGGMGVISPARITTGTKIKMQKIAEKLVCVMRKEGIDYRGLCYIGFMMVDDEPYVLEINCRFGDPETQPLMMRMKSDIVPILLACTNGTLDKHKIEWYHEPAVCVVLAAKGYPENPERGKAISGLDDFFLKYDQEVRNAFVFHSGTIEKNGRILTNGGRVLCATALGFCLEDAAKRAYKIVNRIHFEGMQYRKDIPRNLRD